MGGYCATRDRSTRDPGPADARGFCWPDEQHGRFAIEQLPADWYTLMQRIGKDAGRQGLGGIPTGRAEAPIPLREHIEALTAEIAWTLALWAEPVRERAHLSSQSTTTEHQWQQRTRAGWAVQQDSTTLVRHYSVLLAVDAVEYQPYDTRGMYVTDDGPAGVVQLAGLHHRARAVLGVTRRREPRDLPCPIVACPKHDRTWCRDEDCATVRQGCGQYTLGEVSGSGESVYDVTQHRWVTGPNVVDCTTCGWWCTADEYAQYALSYVPPGVKVPA